MRRNGPSGPTLGPADHQGDEDHESNHGGFHFLGLSGGEIPARSSAQADRCEVDARPEPPKPRMPTVAASLAHAVAETLVSSESVGLGASDLISGIVLFAEVADVSQPR